MKIRIKNKRLVNYLFFILFLVSPFKGFFQVKFNPEQLLDYKKFGSEISNQLNTIEVSEYADTLKKSIYLRNGFRSSKFLNESEWLSIKDSVEPYRIDIVYSKYPLREGVYSEIYSLLFNRLNSLFTLDAHLNDTEIEWNKVLQTHCINDAQVNKLFHGVVIWYKTIEKESKEQPFIEPKALSKYEIIELEEEKLLSEQNSLEDLTQTIENIKSYSYFSDSIKKALATQSISQQIKSIKTFLEQDLLKTPETPLLKATESDLKKYDKEVNNFLKKYPTTDSVVTKVLDRHPEWKNCLVINDWTGSMYGYGAQVLNWHLANFKKSGIISLTLFNDGDQKNNKRVGETGGIYFEKADNILRLVKLFNYVMLKGSGGDGPENDIEGILKAIEEYPYYSEIILIADNNACVRDIELADRIGKPVKVIICGYNKDRGINPDYIYLAKKTGGGVYTIEDDLENISVELGTKGTLTSLIDTRFKVFAMRCNDGYIMDADESVYDLSYAKHHKKRVRKLSIENKELVEIPHSVYKMKKLHYLNLSHNKISDISDKIENLEYLKTLILTDNKLNALPKTLKYVYFIEKLALDSNSFTSVPIVIHNMKFLTELNLAHNKISILDKNIALKKIQTLNVSHNEISEITNAISQLKTLKKLDLSNNKLTILPENMSNLLALRYLNLANNNLTKLPTKLNRWINLKTLILTGNSFSEEEKTRIKNTLTETEIIF
jgi:hypothetical protein